MSISSRLGPRLCRLCLGRVQVSHCNFTTSLIRRNDEEWPQRMPIGPYYEALLNSPRLESEPKPEGPPNSADPAVLPDGTKPVKVIATGPHTLQSSQAPTISNPPSVGSAQTTPNLQDLSPEEKVRIVFGTRLAGPEDMATHKASTRAASKLIAGVLVPPEPTEPDNCCMSGCVNCVWELYREDMEEYKVKKAEADSKLAKAVEFVAAGVSRVGNEGRKESMSEAQVEPEAGPGAKEDAWDDSLFQNVPVGIREFMKQERRLKEKHSREESAGV